MIHENPLVERVFREGSATDSATNAIDSATKVDNP